MEVQRWPAVPTAPKSVAGSTISKSASSMTIRALLPPQSKMPLPKRAPTLPATSLPMAVEPVKEIRGSRVSSTMGIDTSSLPPITRPHRALKPSASSTGRIKLTRAMAHRGGSGWASRRRRRRRSRPAWSSRPRRPWGS